MKTQTSHTSQAQGIQVYILPLRNENFPSKTGTISAINIVYILPLRNENILTDAPSNSCTSCLYPTFKEWKL